MNINIFFFHLNPFNKVYDDIVKLLSDPQDLSSGKFHPTIQISFFNHLFQVIGLLNLSVKFKFYYNSSCKWGAKFGSHFFVAF